LARNLATPCLGREPKAKVVTHDAKFSGIGRFIFSSPFVEFPKNFIDVQNENVLYN
jgi:hypothetical protein